MRELRAALTGLPSGMEEKALVTGVPDELADWLVQQIPQWRQRQIRQISVRYPYSVPMEQKILLPGQDQPSELAQLGRDYLIEERMSPELLSERIVRDLNGQLFEAVVFGVYRVESETIRGAVAHIEIRPVPQDLPEEGGREEGNEGVRISRKLEDPNKVSSSRTHEFVLWKFNSARDEVHVRYMRKEGDSSAWVEIESPPEVLAYPDPLWNGIVVPQIAARGGFAEPLSPDAQAYLRSLIQPLRGGASTQILSTALEAEKRNKKEKPVSDRGIVLFDTRTMRIVGRVYLRYPPEGDSAEFRIVAPEDVPVERYRVYASSKKKLAAAAETAASTAAVQETVLPVKETTPLTVAEAPPPLKEAASGDVGEKAVSPIDLGAGLDYPSDNAGLRRAVLENGQLIVWGYSASQPDQTVRIEAVEVKGSRARLAFTTPPEVLIYRDKLWRPIAEEIRAKGGLANPAAQEYLRSFVNREKPESRLVLGMKPEKDYGAADLYPPDQRGEPVILFDTSTFRIIAFVYLRALDSSKAAIKAELRVVAPNDVRLDHPEAYEGKKARSQGEQPPADGAGLEEAIPYDQVLLVPDGNLNSTRLFTSRQDQPANLFLPIGEEGVFIPKRYLAEWGNRGFLVMNGSAGGNRFLQVSVTRRSSFPKVSTVFYASDAVLKRQRLGGAGASRTVDGIRVEVTSQGVVVRPHEGAQVYVERLMTPQEKRVQDIWNEMNLFLEGQRWERVTDLLRRADRLSLPERSNQSPWMRRTLDLLEIGRFQMLMNRHLPAIWLVGDPISRSAENDIWKMLKLADQFLRQDPPVDPQYRKLVRTLIAQAVLTLSAAGSLTEKVQVERIFTNPDVPLGHVVALLHERWLARLLQEQQGRGGQLDLPNPFYTRALAYGLVNNVVPASQYLSPSDQARSPDSLLIFLEGGLNVSTQELARRRQAVRRVVLKEVWDIVGGSPGRLPQDLIEETLMPYDLSILEVGGMAAHLLGRVAEELGLAADVAKFRQIRVQLNQQLAEIPHKLAPRVDATSLVHLGVDVVIADNLATHDQTIQALREGIVRLLGERTEEPGVEPDWIHFYSEDPFLDYWVEVGTLETWTENWDQAVPQMIAALQFLDQGTGQKLYQVHFRTIRQREQGRWVQVLLPEVQALMADEPERLVSDEPKVGGNGNFGTGGGLEEEKRSLPSEKFVEFLEGFAGKRYGRIPNSTQGWSIPLRQLPSDGLTFDILLAGVPHHVRITRNDQGLLAAQVSVSGTEFSHYWTQEDGPVTFGRGPDNTVVLLMSGYSRQQAAMWFDLSDPGDPRFVVYDGNLRTGEEAKASSGGTWIPVNDFEFTWVPIAPSIEQKRIAPVTPSDVSASPWRPLPPAVTYDISGSSPQSIRRPAFFSVPSSTPGFPAAVYALWRNARGGYIVRSQDGKVTGLVPGQWFRFFEPDTGRLAFSIRPFAWHWSEIRDFTGTAQMDASGEMTAGKYPELAPVRTVPEDPIIFAEAPDSAEAFRAGEVAQTGGIKEFDKPGFRFLEFFYWMPVHHASVRVSDPWNRWEGIRFRLTDAIEADQLLFVPLRDRNDSVVNTRPLAERGWQIINGGTGQIIYTSTGVGKITLGRFPTDPSLGRAQVFPDIGEVSKSHLTIEVAEQHVDFMDDSLNGSFVEAFAVQAGLEESRRVSLEEFIEILPFPKREQIPAGASSVWITPLSNINLYAHDTLIAGLGENFLRRLPPDLRSAVKMFRIPLMPTEAYQRPGIIFKDAGLNQPVDNPLGLPLLEMWLADLEKVNPAAVIMLALRGREDAGVKLLGLMTYQDAKGQTYLAVFA